MKKFKVYYVNVAVHKIYLYTTTSFYPVMFIFFLDI